MDELLRLLIVVVLSSASLCAYFAALSVLFPRRVARTYAALQALPRRAFLVGLVNLGFFSTLVVVLGVLADRSGIQLLTLLAGLLLLLVLAGLSIGLAAVVQQTGERLAPQAAGLRQAAWGAVTLALACALPVAGWFVLLPYVSALGLGAFILGFFQRPEG